MASRQRILEAALRVYEEAGFRGATTRRIAAEAEVNEVTLFRIFGSKESLLSEAIRAGAGAGATDPCGLPEQPVDPELELTSWCDAQMKHLRGNRSLIRKTMAEMEERPELGPCACAGPRLASHTLRAYIERLCRGELVDADCPAEAASTMLLGVVFSDAMWRDTMPEVFPQPADDAPRLYARLFLKAIGFRGAHEERRTRKKPASARRA